MDYLEYIVYVLFIGAIILSLYAQIKVSGTFRKYSASYTFAGRTGAEVARTVLSNSSVYCVQIARVRGNLTDHFDPRSNTLALSDGVYASSSTAAIGVAAHEAGHAVQHSVGYFPIRIRAALVPVTTFASRASWLFIMLGVLLLSLLPIGYYVLLFGVALFAITTLFQLVTLPCEFDASRRALEALRETGEYSSEELRETKKVLTAAAMTYVAATLVSALQLIRLLLIFTRGNRRR